MRTPIDLPSRLVDLAKLYAPGRDSSDAVSHVIEDYPRLVAKVRKLSSALSDFQQESADFDLRLAALQLACWQLLDL